MHTEKTVEKSKTTIVQTAHSGGYLKLAAPGKDFQNLMFSKKNMALISYFPFSQNHSNL